MLTLLVFAAFLSSCTKPVEKNTSAGAIPYIKSQTRNIIRPAAVLQTGEIPLWFQFTGNGPLHIDSIGEACFSQALIPWPLAPHAKGFLVQNDSLLLAVNREGFFQFTPNNRGIIMYRIPGGEFWRPYTLGAFFFFDQNPVSLLYLDDIFVETEDTVPLQRLWTYNLFSPSPLPFNIPFLDKFAAEEGWNVESMRFSGGCWYYKALNKKNGKPEIHWLRSKEHEDGEEISAGVFRSGSLPQPLENAPLSLQKLLLLVFERSGCSTASVTSADFLNSIDFTINGEGETVYIFYSNKGEEAFILAANPKGTALYLKSEGIDEIKLYQFSLPSLPETFVYTGIGLTGDNIIATWEERQGYSIGAAGLMAMKLGNVEYYFSGSL